MADEIAGVGIRVDTDDVSKGIKALDALADQGPKVEKSLQGVEAASAKTGKSLATLGQGTGADAGLAKVGKSSKDAADGMGKLGDAAGKTVAAVKQIDKAGNDTARAIAGVGTAVKSLVTSNEAVVASIRGVVSAESAYTAKLAEEAKALRAAIAERDKYIAQAQGMLTASKDIAAAIGGQVASLKQVQGASAQASESMLAMVRTGVGAFLGGAVVAGAKAAATAIYEASAAGERLRTVLNFASGGNGAQEIEYLRQVTGRLGLEFASTARAYGSFQAAARGTSLEGAKARDIFESIAKASAVMGLSTENTSGVLLALQQIISKGTVSAEELRGQLGERLPGAFQIAAKAMGVTTAELGKMLEQGLVIADDFLPRFAKAMNENIGDAAEQAADRLDASTNRMANAWEKVKQTIGDAGVSSFIKGEIQALTDDITVFGETMEKVGKSGGGFLSQIAAAGAVEAGRAGFAILNGGANTFNATLNTLTNNFLGFLKLPTQLAVLPDFLKTSAQQAAAMAQELGAAEKRFADLKAQGGAEGGNVYWKSELFQVGQYIEKLKEAQRERAGLTKQAPYSEARDTAAAETKRLDSIQAAMAKVVQGLSGVKDGFFKDLNALKAGYDAGLLKLSDYQQAVKKLIDESGGGKATAAALKGINKELSDQAKLLAESAGLTSEFAADWAGLSKAFGQGMLSVEQLTEAQAKLLAKQPAIKAAKEQEIALNRALYAQSVQTSEEIAAGYVAESKAREQGRLAVYEYGRAIDEQNALTELELSLVGRTQQAREVALAQYRIELELKKQIQAIDKNAGFDEAQRIEERTKAREAAARAIAGAERRVYVDEWKRTSDEIERSLTDALLRGFESGKGFAENLKDTVVNLFKTLVLRPVISAVISPIAGGITGLLGLSGAANAAGAAGGLLGSVGGGLGNIFGGIDILNKGGIAGLGLGGASLSGIGSAIGAGFMNTIGGGTLAGGQAAGLLAGGAGTGTGLAGMFGAALPWVGGAALIGNALGLFRKTEYKGTSLRGTLGMGDINSFDVTRKGGSLFSGPKWRENDRGESPLSDDVQAAYNAVRQATAGMAQTLGLNAEAIRNYTQALYIDGNGKSPEEMQKLLTDALTAANDQVAAFALGTTEYTKTGETASQTLARLSTSLQGVNFVLDELGQTTLAATLAGGSIADQLASQFGGLDPFIRTASSYYEAYYSEAERAAKTTEQVTKGLAAFGIAMPSSREAFRALVEAQDITTESGRKAYAALLQLSPAFAELVPATEALADAAGTSAAALQRAAEQMAEAGRRALAGLADEQGGLQVELLRAQGQSAAAAELERQRAIASITTGLSSQDAAAATAAYDFNAALRQQIDGLNNAAAAAQQAAEAEAQRTAAIAQERSGLESQLLQIQGNTPEIRARELAALDASNRATLQRIFALQDEQAAQQLAAQAAQQEQQRLEAVATQRDGLVERLLQLQGDTGALRARELLALDESNRTTLERIFALQDEQAATQAATQAAQELAAKQVAVASERESIQGRIDQLLGNTAAIRARELAGLDQSNRALQERYFALEDERAAQELANQANRDAAQAAEEQARAAAQLRDAWQSVTDTIYDEVARIRGLLGGNASESLAEAQSRFAITTAQARAGDQDAAKQLPSLGQTLLQLAEQGANSLLDIQRIRAQVAASLEQTGGALTARFGLAAPRLSTGTNYVPQDMLAVIHKGEAVVPRQFNPAAGGGAGGNAAMTAEIKGLREDNKAQALALVRLQTEMTKLLKKWDGEGIPEERSVAA